MPDEMMALRSAWETYYVILGSSAAALTGLQFVVIALISDSGTNTTDNQIATFATPTVLHFCAVLLISAIVSAPWPTLTPVDLLLGLTGAAGLLYTVIIVRRARRERRYRLVMEDLLWHAILPFGAYASLFGAALRLRDATMVCLFLTGAASLLLVFVGIHNAWDTVTYIAIAKREQSGEAPTGGNGD